MSDSVYAWIAPSVEDAEALLAAAAERFPSQIEPVELRERTYLDTFDRRVAHLGEALIWQPRPAGPHLCRLTRDGRAPQRFPMERAPEFAAQLPAPLQGMAKKIAMRRLLPEVRLRVERRVLRLLDSRRKTVARLAIERGRAFAPGKTRGRVLSPMLVIEPLKGYERRAAALAGWIAEQPGMKPAEGDSRERAMSAVGLDPDGPSRPARPSIERGLPAVAATRMILRAQFEELLLNEQGTRAALDTEFLHDYRVAVRRTRSALSQIKGVFGPRALRRYSREFAWLGAVTGPMRDLDVYLLTLPDYRSWLPAAGGDELDPLERLLLGLQKGAQRALVRALDSVRYRRLLESWPAFLDQENVEISGAPNAARAVELVSAERIHAVWTKVLKRGTSIDHRTPSAKVHRLRIDCKKLRYLLEFFGGLFPGKELPRAVRRLKTLQDNLGLFNDLEVQQQQLREAGSADGEHRLPRETLLAMGRLVERLAVRQGEVREEFYPRFARFARCDARRSLEQSQ